MSVRDAIRDHNRLARMRQGQDAPEMTDIPSMDGVRVAQVPLTEAELQQGLIRAAGLDVQDNTGGLQARNRLAVATDVWNSLREPDNLDQKVFESVDAMMGALESTDIDYLADALAMLMDYASPSIDGLTDKDIDDLKKALVETDWNALTGRRWAAVKLCCTILFPEILLARSLGSGSTESLTETSESA